MCPTAIWLKEVSDKVTKLTYIMVNLFYENLCNNKKVQITAIHKNISNFTDIISNKSLQTQKATCCMRSLC